MDEEIKPIDRRTVAREYLEICDLYFQESGTIPRPLLDVRAAIFDELILTTLLFKLLFNEYRHLFHFFKDPITDDDADEEQDPDDGPLSMDKTPTPVLPRGISCQDRYSVYGREIQ